MSNKHYILMEVTTDDGSKPDLKRLKEAISFGTKKVDFTLDEISMVEKIDQEKAELLALNDVTSGHDFKSDKDALEALNDAADSLDEVPDDIFVWEPFEDLSISAVSFLDVLRQSSVGYVGKFQLMNGGK